ncbi:hypothetical protein ARNL5_02326 [Anaerolineae bacterium]|nr:hypothetical protein ARNL5_02326 [Anaerolineae bacterium]
MRKKPIVYFDNCALERLIDEGRSSKVLRQRAAMQVLMAIIDRGEMRFAASTWNLDEAREMSGEDRERKLPTVQRILAAASIRLDAAEGVDIANAMLQHEPRTPHRLRIRDALHLGIGVLRQVDYFITTDDRLRKWANARGRAMMLGRLRVLLPQELVGEIGHAARHEKEEE